MQHAPEQRGGDERALDHLGPDPPKHGPKRRHVDVDDVELWSGTRFVASDEAFVHPAYKRRIVDGKADDTILNELYDVWWPNAPHRTLRNKTSGEWEAAGRPTPGQRPGEGTPIGKRRLATGDISDWPRYAIGVATPDFDGDVEYAPLWAGESCSVVNDIRPAGELVRDLARDAANVLASVTA